MIYKIFLTPFLFLVSVVFVQAQTPTNWDLKACVDYALQNNLQVKQQSLLVTSSEATLKAAKTNRYPNLNGGANYNTSIGYVNDPFTNEFDNQTINSSNYSLSTNLNIFSGFQTANTIHQGKIDLQANEFDLEQSKNNIVLAVVNAYLTILLNQELVASSEAQLATTQTRRERTKKLVDAGTLAVASLLDLESQIATEELQVVNQQNLLDLSYLNLQQLLTLDPNEKFEITNPTLEADENDYSDAQVRAIYQKAVGSQPNIRAAELRISSADYGIKIAQGVRYPTLSFGANVFSGYSSARKKFNTLRGDLTQEFIINGTPATIVIPDQVIGSEELAFPYPDQIWENRNFGFGFNLSIPIYNRGQVMNGIQQSQIALERARYASQLEKQTLKQTIQQSYLDLKSAYSTFQATQKQIQALQTTFNNTEKQFNLGILNSVDYLQAKNNLARANFDLVRTKYTYIFRAKILDFYNGETITLD